MLRSALSVTLCQSKYVKRGQPRRATHHAMSSTKLGKGRFDLAEALYRDRQRVENNRTLPWRARIKQIRSFPWKFFFAFMLLWSWLGTYVVPYVKGMHPRELPALGEGIRIPEELQQRATPMPAFMHRGNGDKLHK
ncbi:hypothetical protein BCY84_02185 [Trypanosoma cruzi cruzi]|uniref:Transmembrane protein n=1 Tax=Trypanosoma cruzi TaxID=5693 RepID=A0A2V2UQ34_TRYCR|nr:hypothetical protein BCY84_21550 [Trypanosoma cruzi cruzi]PBJ79770.1 hypothetical protein BCY84_02185 [Trypanosoma cruzi cruzi]PWU86190.1 hypothetical protein C4B63_130g85c [Trypanosoma cruzi]